MTKIYIIQIIIFRRPVILKLWIFIKGLNFTGPNLFWHLFQLELVEFVSVLRGLFREWVEGGSGGIEGTPRRRSGDEKRAAGVRDRHHCGGS